MIKPYSTRNARGRLPQTEAQLTTEIAHTRDGRDTTRPFTRGLQEPRDPRLLGAVDWGVYDRILKDDQVFSTMQQRRTAVVSRNWSVLPGDEDDPRSVEAADRFGKTLARIGWDRVTDKMLMAVFYGYSVAELVWKKAADGLMDIDRIVVRHARRFRVTDTGELRLLTRAGIAGEQLPPRKFWMVTAGGADDDEIYGRGLAEWLYWPVQFKTNGLRFWNTFLDKFGSPTAVAKYRPGMSLADRNNLLAALAAIATDSGIAVPEGVAIELLQASRGGTGDYATLCARMDAAISKIVLSQTMTTDDGSSKSQAEVHGGVKLEVIRADADLLSDGFNGDNGPARWWTDLNYGVDVAAPRVVRETAEEADTKAEADTDTVLKGLGWERTEESFRDTYGDGYERVAPLPDKTGAFTKPAAQPVGEAANDDSADEPAKAKAASFAADDLRPLYVYRRLLNAADLIRWARAQGLSSTLKADDMHVTVTYSKRPVNWMKMGGLWGWTGDNAEHLVPPGGPRLIERFGEGAVVLVFFSGHLEQRHREMRDAGASWDHDGYFPHVTITYEPGAVDVSAIEPYRGELRFGPEIFEPIEDAWRAQIRESSFAEAPLAEPPASPVDVGLIDELVKEAGYTALSALTAPMIAAAAEASSPEELYRALATLPGDAAPLTQSLERAGLAVALDAEFEGAAEP